MSTESVSDISTQSQWQRLSPVSILYFILKFTVNFVKQGLINIIPALAAFTIFVNNKGFWISVMIPALILFILLYSSLYFWNFKFKSEQGKILIHRGVINKERLNLQFSRVQNVNIGVPFYFTPFHIVNCMIESAGSKTTEVNLPGVSQKFAETLRDKVFAVENKVTPEETAPVPKEGFHSSTDQPILKLSNWESAKSGLTSYLAFVVLAAFAPFSKSIGDFFEEQFFPTLMGILEPVVGNPVISGSIIALGSVLTFLMLIIIGSMAGALIRFFNYELFNTDDKLIRIAGLFERKSTTLTKSKVQSILIRQNIVAKLLKRVTLLYRQVGTKDPKSTDSSVQIPLLKPSDTKVFSSIIFQNYPEPEFAGIHSSYVGRVFFYFWLIPYMGVLSILGLFVSKLFLFALILLFPVLLLIKQRSRRFGFWFNEEYGAIRQGLFGHEITVFPLEKIQLARVRQSRGQKRREVGNLTVQLGSGETTIPYLPMSQLNQFLNLSLYKTEISTKSWM